MKNQEIYLDNNSTTPCDPRVVQIMIPFFNEIYGNPANGLHSQGRRSFRAVEEARTLVADVIGANSSEIFFTGNATESNNLAIFGFTNSNLADRRKRIVTSSIEHKSVLAPCKKLEDEGFDVIYLPVDSNGIISIEMAKNVIDENTLMVSIQFANNEIGTIQPIREISELAHRTGALFHCDAVQAIGKMNVNVDEHSIDLLSMSAHKFYGPKGIGALYIRNNLRSKGIEPRLFGGGQELGVRSGTLNVQGIVGFGEACRIIQSDLDYEISRYLNLRNKFEENILERIPISFINAKSVDRLPNTSSVSFPGIKNDAILLNCPQIMAAVGSACSSGTIEPSHVLLQIGMDRIMADSTLRFSLGRFTTEDLIDAAIDILHEVWIKLSY